MNNSINLVDLDPAFYQAISTPLATEHATMPVMEPAAIRLEPAHVHKDGQPRRIRMDVEEYLLMKQELGDAST